MFQDGSAEVPTGAWGITPPRIGSAEKHAPAVGRGLSETSPNPVGPTRRPANPSSRKTGGFVPRSPPRPTYARVHRKDAETPSLPPLATSSAARTDPHATRDRGSAPEGGALELNPRRVQRAVSAVSLQTGSRPIELSLQSTFQLSLTVLVHYRTRARI